MKIENTLQEDHQMKLVVELETEAFEKTKRQAAKKLSKRVKIPGFRPGKAPYNMVQRHVGDGAIVEEAIDIVLEHEYPKIIEETGITPYGPGSLIDIPNLEPPTFEFIVPLAPEIELGDYRELRIDFEEKEVTEKDIQETIDNLRDQQAILETVDRAAKVGDMVYTLISGERKDAEDEAKKVLFEERRYPVVVEKKSDKKDDEWPFPGFNYQLKDLKAGDETTLEHKFPKNFDYEEWQGITGVFTVKVEEIKSRSLPDLDDEFAKSAGDYETVDDMKAEIRKSLTENFKTQNESDYETKVIDQVIESSTVKYPPQMLDHEIEHIIEDLGREISYQGMDMDLYLKTREITMEELRAEATPNAETRIKRGLVLMEVGKQEDIQVDTNKVQQQADQTLAMIRQIYPEDQARQFTSGDALNNLLNRIISDEITRLTLTRLRKFAMGLDPDEVDEIEEEEEVTEESAPVSETEGDVEAKVAETTEADDTEEAPVAEAAAEGEEQSEAETASEEPAEEDSQDQTEESAE